MYVYFHDSFHCIAMPVLLRCYFLPLQRAMHSWTQSWNISGGESGHRARQPLKLPPGQLWSTWEVVVGPEGSVVRDVVGGALVVVVVVVVGLPWSPSSSLKLEKETL